jgi:hypothetical protein
VDRVLASEAKGRGFDPRQPHHLHYAVQPNSVVRGFFEEDLKIPRKAKKRRARIQGFADHGVANKK